jgi:hypothetical protein
MDRMISPKNRLGLHYPPDEPTRVADLQCWKPLLVQVGASWLVLEADGSRAIPEVFLRGLLEIGVRPLLHFKLPLDPAPRVTELEPLLRAYSRWGVRYAVFFDRPNASASWPSAAWTQHDLVERFLDRFLPLAETAWQVGIIPMLPPLEPGGSYWDTAFLRAALQGVQRRKPGLVQNGLGLSAYAWSFGRPVSWGWGGSERWPDARPYLTPEGSQDQRGLGIFDWYRGISRSAAGRELPLFLFEAGSSGERASCPVELAEAIACLLQGEAVAEAEAPEGKLTPFPGCVMGAALRIAGRPQDEAIQAWAAVLQKIHDRAVLEGAPAGLNGAHPIHHYLLLPVYEWGVPEWHLDAIKPFIRKYQPTVGFSLVEAALAESVTVLATEGEIPESALDQLRFAGCKVERIEARGTSLASLLAER